MEIRKFITESNRIEGISRAPTNAEYFAHDVFMKLPEIHISALVAFVEVYEPRAKLRDASDVPNVRIGGHVAPESGPQIVASLEALLLKANNPFTYQASAHEVHKEYEALHPFTDCNGRSGRMLWMWMMREAPLGFLHTWYYQTLQHHRRDFLNPGFEQLDAVLHDMSTPHPKVSKQWLREFYCNMLKAEED